MKNESSENIHSSNIHHITDNDPELNLHVEKLYYWFEDTETPFLRDISFDVHKKEFILVIGASGSGKSLLIKCLNGIIPHLESGDISGKVLVNGHSTADTIPRHLSKYIGCIFQNPDDQIVCFRVCDEIAWGLENQDLPRDEIVKRVKHYLGVMKIENLIDRLMVNLSGGQKQKAVITANLAMEQGIILFDDPTTDLDPVSKHEVVTALYELCNTLDTSHIVIEHDLTDLIEFANRILVVDKGSILFDGEPRSILEKHYPVIRDLGVLLPDQINLGHYLKKHGIPFSVKKHELIEAFSKLWAELSNKNEVPSAAIEPHYRSLDTEVVIEFKDVTFGYDKNLNIIENFNFHVNKGEFIGIIGQNGSGKSTIVKHLVGLVKAQSGQVMINGRDVINHTPREIAHEVGYLFQNPDHQLFLNSVREELLFSLKESGISLHEQECWMKEVLEIVGLSGCEDLHPFTLSRGARQKLAVATVLVNKPKIIVLDEPTTGQDKHTLVGLLNLMHKLVTEMGSSVVMITHDMEVVAEHANRIAVISDGKIVMDGNPRDIFYNEFDHLNELYLRPPFVVEMAHTLRQRGFINTPRWMSVNEALQYIAKPENNNLNGDE